MSVRVNLLPDVRLQKIHDTKLKHTALGIAVLIWAVMGVVSGGLLLAYSAAKIQLSMTNRAIANDVSQLNGMPELNDALTAQKATTSLASLYDNRPYFSQFIKILYSRLPSDVSVSSVQLGAGNTLTITGVGKSIFFVDKLDDSLKAAKTTPSDGSTGSNYFSNVVISEVSKDSRGNATFGLTATVNQEAFNGQK